MAHIAPSNKAHNQRRRSSGGTQCIFPSLHSDVSAPEECDLYVNFRDGDDQTSIIRKYITNILHRDFASIFKCW